MAILVGLNSIAAKFKLPYPILLVISGLIIGIIPELPNIQLNPSIVFLIFLPPLLYEAAYNTSWHNFKRLKRPILFLAIGLVIFTTVGVATVAHYVIPGFTWPLSFLLGALVSPPDAVAATSITKYVRLPKHVITILEGESLINDASALIIYRYALIAVTGGQAFTLSEVSLQFMIVAGSGVFIGIVVAYAVGYIHRSIENPTTETTISLITPFVAYVIAEIFDVSGVLAVVSAGIFLAWQSPEILSFQTRFKIKGFWDIVIFLLNGIVFIMIGLQLPTILEDLSDESIILLIGYGLLISLVAIIARIAWVFTLYITSTLLRQKSLNQTKWSELFIISWSGMRGVVSLAGAMAIPLTLNGKTPFPERKEILFITFIVILVTLVFQGLTLPFFIRKLKVEESTETDKIVENNLRLTMLKESLEYIDNHLSHKFAETVINRTKIIISERIDYIKENLDNNIGEHDLHRIQFYECEMEIWMYQRKILIQMHKNNAYNDEIIRKVEQDLDIYSMGTHTRLKAIKRHKINMPVKPKH
jgi:CPA1 family monovalent cation:H+ antiporter